MSYTFYCEVCQRTLSTDANGRESTAHLLNHIAVALVKMAGFGEDD